MYKIGICDDDKILCSALEERICELSKELEIKAEIDVRMFTKKLHNGTIDIVESLQKKERVHAEKKVRQSFHGAAG